MTNDPNGAPCRLLHVEDSPDDADLVRLALARGPLAGARITRVDTETDYVARLADPPDAIICDYQVPRFSAERALELLRARGLDIPFIIVSHHIDGSAAVMAMQRGASDYLSKGDLLRLPKAIGAALERGRARAEQARAEKALRASEALTRGILDSLDSRIAVLDERGTVVATNRAWDAFAANRAQVPGSGAAAGDNYLEVLRAAAAAGDTLASASHDAIAAVIARDETFAALEYQASLGGAMRSFVVRAFPLEGTTHGAVVAHQDVSDRMMAHLALEDAHRRLQALSRRVLSVQEEERRGIARELHDDACQSLAALETGLQRAMQETEGPARERVGECMAIAQASAGRLRRIAQELRPPQLDRLGLADALAWLAERQRAATGLAVECRFSGLDRPRPPIDIETACYRIAQEAIANAARHGHAKAVVVSAEADRQLLRLTIHDDGVGFDAEPTRERALRAGSMGLIGMEERARLAGGRLRLRSLPGHGTTVTAVFPLGDRGAALPAASAA